MNSKTTKPLLLLIIFYVITLKAIYGFASSEITKASDFKNAGFVGFNLDAKSVVPLNKTDFEDIGKTGANLVRVAIRLKHCSGCNGYKISAEDINYLDTVIAGGMANGYKVVITFQVKPEREQSEYWRDSLLRASIINNWKDIAMRYRNNTTIAGYDLINEPTPPGLLWSSKNALWVEFGSELIRAIREIDPDRVIIFESVQMGAAFTFGVLEPLPFNQIVYSFHFYMPLAITHQGLFNFRAVIPYPSDSDSPIGVWDKERLSKELGPVRAFANRFNVPIYVGEFGCIRSAPNGSAYRYVSDLLDLFKREGWSWNYHAFRQWNGWDAEIPSDDLNFKQRSTSSPLFDLLEQNMRVTH